MKIFIIQCNRSYEYMVTFISFNQINILNGTYKLSKQKQIHVHGLLFTVYFHFFIR